MDSTPTIPKQDHGSAQHGRHLTRTQRPPKYYLIDFGISVQFEPGADRMPPEFDDSDILSLPQDAFRTNVCHIGNLVREGFLDICDAFSL
jgi:hypothetical protein